MKTRGHPNEINAPYCGQNRGIPPCKGILKRILTVLLSHARNIPSIGIVCAEGKRTITNVCLVTTHKQAQRKTPTSE